MENPITQRFRHDVRGALNVIRLHAELLRLPFEPAELRHILAAIEDGINDIEELVASLSVAGEHARDLKDCDNAEHQTTRECVVA